jgi:DNA-binding transcriptional LysR family regulator
MEFDLRQLEAFVGVVNNRGFSAAAKAMHLSQAAVSERVANLEHAVGMRLLDRGPREIQTTSVGERFYTLARQLLEHKQAVSLELSELAGVVRGTLRIGASNIPGEYLLPPLLPTFCSDYPRIELDMQIRDSVEIMEYVHNGEIELGVIGAKPTENHFTVEQLWEDRLLLVVPAGHRLAGRKSVSADEIADDPFIMREQGSGTRKLLEAVLSLRGIDLPPVRATLGSTTAVKEAVIGGLGVTITSERAVRKEAEAGILAAIELRGLKFERNFLLITDKGRTQSPLCKRFVEYLRECYRTDTQV